MRPMQLGIRGKSLLLFCLSALLPLAIMSLAALLVVRHVAERLVTNDLVVATRTTLENLERFFADRVVDLHTWADLRVMQDVVIDDQDGEIRRDLAKLLNNYPYFAELSVLNGDGRVVAATRASKIGSELAGASLFRITMEGRSYQGAVSPSAVSDSTIFTFAEPIRANYDRELVIGTLIGVISWDKVRDLLSKVSLTGVAQDESHVLILRASPPAGVLYRTAGTVEFDAPRVDDGPVMGAAGQPAAHVVSMAGRDFLAVTMSSRGDGRFADPGWQLQAAIAAEVALADVDGLRRVLIAIGLLALTAAAAIGWFGTNDLIKPIAALIAAMRRLAAGDNEVAVPALGRHDEIGAMANDLQTFRQAAQGRAREQQELLAAKLAAEKADRAKSDFLATMSHELRTPLNAIIGFSELISSQPVGPVGNPRYLEYANDIHMSGRHLLEIVNDLLDLSKAESAGITLSEDPVDPVELAAAATQIMAVQAKAAGVTVRNFVTGPWPRLTADERRLKQILINLLGNAVKFTHAGGVVRLTAKRTTAGGLCLIVQDNGIGMSADQIPIALAPFGQIDTALNRRHQGTGLGLPLSKRFAEAHGGELTIESKLGAGTTVTVHLPAERVLGGARPVAVTRAAAG